MKATLEMQPMTMEQVKKNAPQAFATTPKPGVSERYLFLPTSRIIEDMRRLGWQVGSASSARHRNVVQAEYGSHVIKFFHPDVYLKDQKGNIESYINVVVMNNHTGTGSFKFEVGIFRLVCSNGLIIKDKDMGTFNLRHKGYSFEQLQGTLNQVLERLPDVVGKINEYNSILLTAEQQYDFAAKAIQLRTGEERMPTARELDDFLAATRKEDEGDSLWVVLNRIQESVIGGGYYAVNASGKLRKAKSIRNIQKDIKLNQQLWELASEYAIYS